MEERAFGRENNAWCGINKDKGGRASFRFIVQELLGTIRPRY